MASVKRKPIASDSEPDLVWYGLKRLGFDETAIPLSGNRTKDQLAIETVAFRIAHAEHEGGLGRFGHFKQIVDLTWNNPDSGSQKRCVWNAWANKMFRKMCEERELGIAGPTSAGKSDPAALYAAVSYMTDPTHTLVLVMSTTIAGAKKRIWKTFREYWESITGMPGKPLWASNEVKGLNYSGTGYGDSSGIYLLASEQSNEKSALDKLIGIKAPRTGFPDESYEGLMSKPEYADLRAHFDEETLRELVPRLDAFSQDRIGRLILIIDEMTGMVESLLNAVNTNLKPGNVGHFQIIGLGNPNLPYDSFGQFCKPKGGWDKVDLLRETEWETETGGLCIRFNGEENPRIVEKNERYSWMLRDEDIKAMEEKYGRDSLFFHRMVLGTWCLTGSSSGIYSPADIELSGARGSEVVWGVKAPTPCSFLDPSFSAGGDRAYATFGEVGVDVHGRTVLLIKEGVTLKINISDTQVPASYQTVRQWKKLCEERGVRPEHAGYDATGGGQPFGHIVQSIWSPAVLGVNSAGPASKAKLPGELHPGTKKHVMACERFSNRATELWYGAHPLFRSRQIFGVSEDLAKELCSRQHSKVGSGQTQGGDARTLKVENKRAYRDREGKSPDESDSFLGLVELCKQRLGLRHDVTGDPDAVMASSHGNSVWRQLKDRARRISNRKAIKKS
jgi:hypothetical protein